MLVSLAWLKKYVSVPVDTPALMTDLTMAGLNVARRIERGYRGDQIVVGKVLEVTRHPNADTLSLCRVEVSPGSVSEIVCGAPNVAAGQWVLVALPGAALPGGTKIRSAKIRGARSDGMICSAKELGLGEDSAGIIVLDREFAIGTPMAEVFPPPGEAIEIEVTPNRSDLLSHVGVAREIAAIYRVPLKIPVKTPATAAGKGTTRRDFEVEIEDGSDCARYVGQRVKGVRVGPSPRWLVDALETVGLRTVNNVVDAANYVMLELGQPLHAFDFEKLRGSRIVVRRGEKREKLLALDGKIYELDPEVLVIADSKSPVALAGIIGGEESSVHDDTTEILIESANFQPRRVRAIRKRFGTSTDAAYRFERGVDPELCRVAAERAADVIREVAGGETGAAHDVYPAPRQPIVLTIRKTATRRLLGADLSTEEIEDFLKRLGFQAQSRTARDVVIEVPSHRLDVREEIDLIEEVARVYGYHQIGKSWSYRCSTYAVRPAFEDFLDALASHMTSRGFSEVLSSSFTDGRELEDFDWEPKDLRRNPVPIRNPLNANHRYLRTSLIPGMLDVTRRNFDHGTRALRLFQIGKTFLSPWGHGQLPEERTQLVILMTKTAGTDFWNNFKKELDLFDLKAEIEMILGAFHIDLASDTAYTFDGSRGRFAYASEQRALVEGGILSADVERRWDFEQAIWFAGIDIDDLHRRVPDRPKFRPLPEYPSARRDLSLVARSGVGYADIQKAVVKSAGALLESLHAFDVYDGSKAGGDWIAYGLRLSFRSPGRTLTDGDVDHAIGKILSDLKKKLGVELRT
jgi:phenylalanyl-tRNA synthetase beta chain